VTFACKGSDVNISGNTILITGGGSGIGRGLAEAFHAAGSRVVIAGRRQDALQETVAANPGMAFRALNIADPAAIKAFAAQIAHDFPALNVLINNAGMMANENLLGDPVDLAVAEATIVTNLLGPIRLTAALLPHLRKQSASAVMMVSSGLAFVPTARAATYCATKAAIHSYSQSLRFQLRGTPVQVIELAPPLVATDLQPDQKANPRAMMPADFISDTMALLKANPAAAEILVERVKRQRNAEATGQYESVFALLNPPG
jgi:uncharacterized oxidoreductase